MPSTTSSSVATAWLSSTVMTPSLPTLSIASAMSSPILASCDEMAATWATSSCPLTGTDSLLISSTTASTAFSIPTFSCIGLAPAVTLRKPSLIIVCASSVAVVVPSPATSLVFVATSRSSCAPVFSMGSLSSISRTIVTPSLVTVGAPNFFSRTTLRPLGPSVMRTAWATVSMPFFRACLASTSNVTVFALYLSLLPYLLLGLAIGCDDCEHVLLGHDQILDFVQLEFVAGVLGVKNLVADLELHRHLGAVVQDPSGAHGLDDAFLGLLLGGVAENLGGDPVRLQDGGDQVGLEPLASEDDLPALDAHQSHPREGSTVIDCGPPPPPPLRAEATYPATAIIAALSVQSSSGGIVRRARSPTTSAARLRSSVLAATPPATTTSATGARESASSSFSRSDSTTECSNAAARSAFSCGPAPLPRSRRR